MQYIIESPKWEGEIRVCYHDNGSIASITFPDVIDRESLLWWATHCPVTHDFMDYLRTKTKARITLVPEKLDFDTFWNRYNKKTGSKALAQQYWDGEKRTITRRPVADADRINIMRILGRYVSRYAGAKKEYQPLASTFLHERMWEAEVEAENQRRKSEVSLLDMYQQRQIQPNDNANSHTPTA